MKFLLEDDNIINKKISQEGTIINTEDNEDIVVVDNNFYYYDGKHYNLVPKQDAIILRKEYERQKRLKELEKNPNFNKDEIDKEETERLERIKNIYQGNTTINNLKSELRGEKYNSEKKVKKSNYESFTIDPSIADIEKDITLFMNNLLAPKRDIEVYTKMGYKMPDRYKAEIAGNDIIYKGRSRYRQELEPKKEKPLVFFYFDRSYSFRPQNYPQKEKLGRALEAMFKRYENEIETKTFYFASTVHDTETAALEEGGNDANNLIADIKERTKDHLANVLILTDSDNNYSSVSCEIEGAVFLVFTESYSENLQKYVHGKMVNKQYFFTQESKIN